ncbi:MAG: hypothetical protein AB7I44_19690 [Hyphomicrobiaceae bacterium]
MDRSTLLVDAKLGAIQLSKLHLVRERIIQDKTVGRSAPAAVERPVLSGGDSLEPNKLYPSAGSSHVRFYLPLYQIARLDSRPGVELRYDGDEDDGEAGRLTIEFSWIPPVAERLDLRVLDHATDLELRYKLPVQGSAAAAEEVVPLQPPVRGDGERTQSVTIFAEKAQFDAVYQAMRDPERSATLHLKHSARVGVRTWRQVMLGGMVSKLDQANALATSGALVTSVLNRETLSAVRVPARTATTTANTTTSRVTVRANPPVETARIHNMSVLLDRPHLAVRFAAQPAARVRAAPAAARVIPATARARPTVRAAPVMVRATPAAARVAAPVVRRATEPTAAVRPVVTSATLTRVNAPAFNAAVAASDLRVNNRAVVPLRIPLDRTGKPAIINTDREASAQLPFHFNPRTQSSVYATETFQTSAIHLLLPRTLTDPSGRADRVVFQDNLMPDVIHLAPTEFRLARSQESPYLPSLSLLTADFATTGEADQAEVLFNVIVSYELDPWLDPEIIELARAELAAEGLVARFTPIVPRAAKLRLELDLLDAEQERNEAEIEASVGIADTLILDHNRFTRLWRERLANPATGVTGEVTYQLFDGTPAQSRVSLSLWQTSPDVFDVDFLGAVGGTSGRYRVRVRNRIESPVAIERLLSERVSDEAAAAPVDSSSLLNRTLQPQEWVDVEYQVTPPEAPVEWLEPIVFGRVEPNLAALLKLLMLNQGYSSLIFSFTVRAADGVFGAAAGGTEPLIGLLVEFDDGSKVELTPEEPESEVTLVGRMIDQLMGEADDQQRYFYRVTNLHAAGEGARTTWKPGQGSADIQVGQAVVQFDF